MTARAKRNHNQLVKALKNGLDLYVGTDDRFTAIPPALLTKSEGIRYSADRLERNIDYIFGEETAERIRTNRIEKDRAAAVVQWLEWVATTDRREAVNE